MAYSISTVAGATSYTWTVPAGATVASGQGTRSITVDFGSSAGMVSVMTINACGSSAARTKNVSVSAVNSQTVREQNIPDEQTKQSVIVSVYPNPADGENLHLNVAGLSDNNSVIALSLYDMFGNKVYSENVFCQNNDCSISLDMKRKLSKGIYLLIEIVDHKLYQEKISVQ